MTVEQAVAVLRQHNAWRRGAENPQGDPAEIGRAIDVLCCLAEYMLRASEGTEQLYAKGRKAWADVPDASKWVDELRGGDDIPDR